jgi:FtsZ-binding cell division protein ZapB
MTKTEKIEKLEKYAQDMKNELTAVQERLKELKGRK